MTTSCYLPVFYCFGSVFRLFVFLKFSLRTFGIVLLFNCQCSLFSCCSFLMRNFLSLTHSFYFVNTFLILFFKFFRTLSLFCDSCNRLSYLHQLVNSFFNFFLHYKTEKEGFEPSRRVSDLYP